MKARAWLSVGAVAVALGAAILAVSRPGPARRAVRSMLAYWPERVRARARDEPPPFAHLAASQVGYAPGMRKRFTAPRAFDSFRVVREPEGTTVLEGRAACQLPTPSLGRVEKVWMGDFSALREPGRYRILAAGLASYPFEVAAEVFDGPLRAVQRGFYFQRAFTALDAAHAEGPWVHGSDAALAPPGVRAGWHDAGDFSIYSASLNTALFWLLQAESDFPSTWDDTNIPESGNGVPDLLDEARWGLNWLLSVQDGSGGFRNSTCQTRYGPYGTNLPDRAAPYRAGEVGTLATARAVGTLAAASVLFRRFDAAFAESMLAAARRGTAYLDAHPEVSDGPTCDAYRADGDAAQGRDTRTYAAAGMLLATGEPRYRADFERSYTELDGDPGYKHFGGFAALLYLRAPGADPRRAAALRERLGILAERARAAGAVDPFQRSAPTFWGSLGAGFTRVGASSVQRCLDDRRRNAADCAQALDNVHHALGRNYLGFAYLSGLRGVTRGRRHAFHQWLAALRAEPYLFPGAVAGGPNAAPEPADISNPLARPIPVWGYFGDPAFPRDTLTPYEGRYTDNDSWSTNEVSLDWQASTLYVLSFARWVAQNPGPAPEVESSPPDAKLPRCDRNPASG
jgi:endoglucanase